MAGRYDLAAAVRPSKQYPGRTAEEMKSAHRVAGQDGVEADARLLSFEPLRRVARAVGRGFASSAGRR